jgi:hypothetical protein
MGRKRSVEERYAELMDMSITRLRDKVYRVRDYTRAEVNAMTREDLVDELLGDDRFPMASSLPYRQPKMYTPSRRAGRFAEAVHRDVEYETPDPWDIVQRNPAPAYGIYVTWGPGLGFGQDSTVLLATSPHEWAARHLVQCLEDCETGGSTYSVQTIL